MKSILVTGGTGFIGGNLVEKLLEDENNKISILTEPSYVGAFKQMFFKHKKRYAGIENRLNMLIGDITKKGLGLNKIPEFDDVYHLAAIYLLEVKKSIAEKVNVEGTKNVVDLVKKIKGLKAFNYVSTCYVSGDRKGRVYEDELDKGQKFNNHYEETKFKAEIIVREDMKQLPTRIFRPAITVGSSKTGETISFNGLYFAFEALNRTLLSYPSLLALPGKGNSKVNFVPVDYLIEAMAAIAVKEETIGKTFQIADPNPLTANEIIDISCKEFKVKKPIIGHMPYFLAKTSFDLGLGKILRIQKELIPYMDAKTEYDTTNTNKALEGTGVRCPRLDEYISIITKYWREHR
ncbi:MAG: SDR family oxidoreductase [Nanoarchaeota archaeon]|nr:SDR family oxidoreductase [Nanoarchaeota archaeon]